MGYKPDSYPVHHGFTKHNALHYFLRDLCDFFVTVVTKHLSNLC